MAFDDVIPEIGPTQSVDEVLQWSNWVDDPSLNPIDFRRLAQRLTKLSDVICLQPATEHHAVPDVTINPSDVRGLVLSTAEEMALRLIEMLPLLPEHSFGAKSFALDAQVLRGGTSAHKTHYRAVALVRLRNAINAYLGG